ncbi:SDR family NAD(P)-dependent oxidoreductase [Streptomyces sp. NBC_01515]|uniref:SDR family NAD(P)-dependent oxidoreductase n=1 Tax=Streptomyces sp. NBC_01515 TaxID=2903890 RepID=UPI00386B83B0
MRDVAGKVALITGAGSGIGLGMAQAFAESGMKVVVTDAREDHLGHAREFLSPTGHSFHFIRLDVTDRAGWLQAADEAERMFGHVHLLANNAGISAFGRIAEANYDDWDRVLGVDLGGVVNGVQTFLGRMLAHGQGGHIISTASMAALTPLSNSGIYSVAKRGVLGMMEALRAELLDSGIGVSVLCPGLTRTDTWGSRPQFPANGEGGPPMDAGMDAFELGRRVLEGVRRNDMYVLTHAEFGDEIARYFEPLLVACDAAPDRAMAMPGGGPPPGMDGAVYMLEWRTGNRGPAGRGA